LRNEPHEREEGGVTTPVIKKKLPLNRGKGECCI